MAASPSPWPYLIARPAVVPAIQPGWLVSPAGQVAATPVPASTVATSVGACPAPPHCPTLPSSESAYKAVSQGDFMSWLKVGRDMVLRGALIWTGIVAYDAIAKREDPYRLQRAIAGAVGIEFFVLAWTWFNAPKRTS
jgi:hypothetical protein